MGYYCTFGGEIHLSEKARNFLLDAKLPSGISVSEFLNECEFIDGGISVYFDGKAKAYAIDEFMDAVAAVKDVGVVDELRYTGEDPDDQGWYYIKPGKWVFVYPQKPPVPSDDDPSWRIVALQKGSGICHSVTMYKSCFSCKWRSIDSSEQVHRCVSCMMFSHQPLPLWEPKDKDAAKSNESSTHNS